MQLEGMVSQLKKMYHHLTQPLLLVLKKINHSDKMFFHYLLTILYFNGQENLVSLTFPSCCISTVARHSVYYCKLIQLYRAIPFYIRAPPPPPPPPHSQTIDFQSGGEIVQESKRVNPTQSHFQRGISEIRRDVCLKLDSEGE